MQVHAVAARVHHLARGRGSRRCQSCHEVCSAPPSISRVGPWWQPPRPPRRPRRKGLSRMTRTSQMLSRLVGVSSEYERFFYMRQGGQESPFTRVRSAGESYTRSGVQELHSWVERLPFFYTSQGVQELLTWAERLPALSLVTATLKTPQDEVHTSQGAQGSPWRVAITRQARPRNACVCARRADAHA